MAFIKIKPADGMRVPMPGGYGLPMGTPLPSAGFSVPSDLFTRRLLADGDAVLVEAPAAEPNPTPSPGPDASTTSSGSAT